MRFSAVQWMVGFEVVKKSINRPWGELPSPTRFTSHQTNFIFRQATNHNSFSIATAYIHNLFILIKEHFYNKCNNVM